MPMRNAFVRLPGRALRSPVLQRPASVRLRKRRARSRPKGRLLRPLNAVAETTARPSALPLALGLPYRLAQPWIRIWVLIACLGIPAPVPAEVTVWIDGDGITHIADDPAAAPDDARAQRGRQALGGLWDSVLGSKEILPSSSSPVQDDRNRRLIRGAVADLQRGENARASAALEAVLRVAPGNPEAHWYLALLDRQRGRYEASEAHLRAFLAAAGDHLEPWRDSAQRRLDELADERRLADEAVGPMPTTWVGLSHPHFRVHYHSQLGRASPAYADTVLRYLGEAREAVIRRLGAVPEEAMGVLFYGRAAYLQAHRHRFSFQTVGFFDGRIHVVSAAHPAGELRSLLFHEYAHAVFREQTGSDRPYWLNEGLAELLERDSQGRKGLTRSERSALWRRIEADRWIPLRRLAPSFSGLKDDDARGAYIESTAAAAWIEAHTSRAQMAQLLARLGEGGTADEALTEALGLDTDSVEWAVQGLIRSEFPPARPKAAQ